MDLIISTRYLKIKILVQEGDSSTSLFQILKKMELQQKDRQHILHKNQNRTTKVTKCDCKCNK